MTILRFRFWIQDTDEFHLIELILELVYLLYVGHSAVLHGCTVEDESFVGMGAVLLDGVLVEKHGMVAAGSLVRQNTKIPAGEVSTILLFLFSEINFS